MCFQEFWWVEEKKGCGGWKSVTLRSFETESDDNLSFGCNNRSTIYAWDVTVKYVLSLSACRSVNKGVNKRGNLKNWLEPRKPRGRDSVVWVHGTIRDREAKWVPSLRYWSMVLEGSDCNGLAVKVPQYHRRTKRRKQQRKMIVGVSSSLSFRNFWRKVSFVTFLLRSEKPLKNLLLCVTWFLKLKTRGKSRSKKLLFFLLLHRHLTVWIMQRGLQCKNRELAVLRSLSKRKACKKFSFLLRKFSFFSFPAGDFTYLDLPEYEATGWDENHEEREARDELEREREIERVVKRDEPLL